MDFKKTYSPIKLDISDGDVMQIDKFLIRKITNEEKGIFLGAENIVVDKDGDVTSISEGKASITPSIFSSLELMKYQACQSIIECDDRDYMIKNLSKLLLSFRLNEFGGIYAPVIFYFKENSDNNSYPDLHFIYPLFFNDNNEFRISTQKTSEVEKVFKLLLKDNDKQNIILERFNNAVSKNTNKYNSFIDLVGILETICVGNDKDELSFRFSLYVSYLLNNKLNYIISFEEVKKMYDIRSKLAHAGQSNKYSQELHNKLKEITKKLIVMHLQNLNQNVKDLILVALKIKDTKSV